jgi:hypothetical protein
VLLNVLASIPCVRKVSCYLPDSALKALYSVKAFDVVYSHILDYLIPPLCFKTCKGGAMSDSYSLHRA